MIYNQWYIVLDSDTLKKEKPLQIRRFGEVLAIWRTRQGNIHCINDRCCHRGASLSCGKVVNSDLECPFHGFIFGGDGKVKMIPANGKNSPVPPSMHVRYYPVYEQYGFIWLWYGDPDKKDGKPFYFEELKSYTYSTFSDHWKVDYSRAIENQLDVVHLPFVHKTTIGKKNHTLVNGPVVEWEGNLMTFYVHNTMDDGHTKPLKPSEIKNYKDLFYLRFYMPNLWQNYISDKLRIVAAFVPIDDENCLIYIRSYQKIIRIPVLKDILGMMNNFFNKIVLNQDKRVVETQLPRKTAYKMQERLIMGDKPIIEYRKRRQELQELDPIPDKT